MRCGGHGVGPPVHLPTGLWRQQPQSQVCWSSLGLDNILLQWHLISIPVFAPCLSLCSFPSIHSPTSEAAQEARDRCQARTRSRCRGRGAGPPSRPWPTTTWTATASTPASATRATHPSPPSSQPRPARQRGWQTTRGNSSGHSIHLHPTSEIIIHTNNSTVSPINKSLLCSGSPPPTGPRATSTTTTPRTPAATRASGSGTRRCG